MARYRRLPRLLLAALTAAACGCSSPPADDARATGSQGAPTAASPRSDPPAGAAAPPPAAATASRAEDLSIPPQAAFLVVDDRGRRIASQHDAVIDTPMRVGSIMKLVTLVAARDVGAIDGTTRIACGRRLRHEGRTLDCVHPPLDHALDAREAIAQSCNTFFVSVAARLSRSALSQAAVSLGLPPVPETASLSLSAIGLDGAQATPRRWLESIRTLVAREQARDGGSLVLDGMRDAARVGSAAALADHGVEALAKTGTAPMPGGGTAGLVVAVDPGRHRAIIVVAPGAAGREAAEIAGRLLRIHGQGIVGDRGVVRVGVAHATGYEVRAVALDDYVAGVVDAEAPADARPTFRRALAIVARTWVARNAGRHAAEGFAVCDLTHCQVFRPARLSGREASSGTRGIVLREPDATLSPAEYSASCGGWLDAGPDPAAIDHDDAWRAELDHRAVLAAIRPLGVGGAQIDSIQIVSRTASGRARTLVVHTDRDYRVDAERFRLAVGRAMGWQHLKSTWFEVTSFSRGFVFTGRGHGHGRGLCVRGAAAMAARGESVERVLRAYFPTASPGVDPDLVTVRVRTPGSMAHARAPLEQRVRAYAAAVADRLGVGAPSEIEVEVHPTIESFQRATGLGWWVSARAAAGRIDLVPLDLLERRGRLDVVVRHELVHLLTAASLEGRPRWVHEGLAIVMARETVTAAVSSPLTCPPDDDFARATSETLPSLYARAAACVSRELATRRWQAVGAPR